MGIAVETIASDQTIDVGLLPGLHSDAELASPYTNLAEYYSALGQRFMSVFDGHERAFEMPGCVDINKRGAPERVERLVQINFTGAIEDEVDMKLNLIGDYFRYTEGASKGYEWLNCLQARIWSPEADMNEIINPIITVGSLEKHDEEIIAGRLSKLDKSLKIAEAVIIAPEVTVLL